MDLKKTNDSEASYMAKRKVASVGLKKIQDLLATFEKNKVANKRLAITGFSLLVLCIAALIIDYTFFDKPSGGEYTLRGEIEGLKIIAKNENSTEVSYVAVVKLESDESLWANVSLELYSNLEQGDLVELKCVSDGNATICSPLTKQITNAP